MQNFNVKGLISIPLSPQKKKFSIIFIRELTIIKLILLILFINESSVKKEKKIKTVMAALLFKIFTKICIIMIHNFYK